MKPWQDDRTISVKQYGAGPSGSVQLANLGAEVIKIADPSPGSDSGRHVVPLQAGEDSIFFEVFNKQAKRQP